MPVDWGKSVVFTETHAPEADARSQLWSALCIPTATSQLQGNAAALADMKAWFNDRKRVASRKGCLVVKGPSGVGKSAAVALCAKESGFYSEHTYANVSRTPQKLEAVLRKLTMCSQPTVLVLDDFESFISETTSMRDIIKFARAVARGDYGEGRSHNQTMVIVCNDMDKTFEPIFDVATVIEFGLAEPAEVQRVLHRVATRVSAFCYVPPMDIFFVAHGSTGDIHHTINQLQFYYTANKRSKKRKKNGTTRLLAKSGIDSAFRNWSTTHRSTSLDCFTKAKDSVIDSIFSMSRGFHMDVRDHLHRDYPLYFHNSTRATLDSMWKVAEEVSACDTAGPDEEDALYDTENQALWGRDNTPAVAHISTGIWLLHDRKRTCVAPRKRKKKKVFSDQCGYNSDVMRNRVIYSEPDKL